MNKIRVVIVDDSALIRSVVSHIVNLQPDMEVVGTAPDPLIARQVIRELSPDVITLDIEMPKMDGLDFLERLMRLKPTPVLMISTLTERGSEATLRALELGAVDFVAKPKLDVKSGMESFADEISAKIRAASKAKVRPLAPKAVKPATAAPTFRLSSTEKIIAIGASTGGTEAIREVLVALPPNCPAVVITQHMPAKFTANFAARLNGQTDLAVSEARDGERILPGHCYIAPGDHHLELARSGANYVARVTVADPVNRHRPSVDVLFASVARYAAGNALGVILTGMGRDGADGLKAMHDAGAYTIAQDEESCVVFGMPREAISAGGVDTVLSINQIAPHMLARLNDQRVSNRI